MIKCEKFKSIEGGVTNPDSIFLFPTIDEEYAALCGDTKFTFSEDELNEVCDKINAIGCTSFQLSAEELEVVIERFKKEKKNDT